MSDLMNKIKNTHDLNDLTPLEYAIWNLESSRIGGGEQAVAELAAMQERIKELMKRLHTNEGYVDESGYSAWQSGYDAAMFDGIDMSGELPCKCQICLKAYADGEQTAIKELTKGNS